MSASTDQKEPDRIEGAPHPRETLRIFGQSQAESDFLEAFNSGRLHHAWLLSGPRGVGKATFAWALARFLIATPDTDGAGLFGEAHPKPAGIGIAPDHPVARRIAAGSDPAVKLIRRGGMGREEKERDKAFAEGRFSQEIRIHEIRELARFIHLSAVDGGRRVVIVDAADDMNTNAANALLKMLEEPPAHTTIFLVSHQPSRLLPTIRSRCRELRLKPLDPPELEAALVQAIGEKGRASDALIALSAGSVGEAVRLINLGGTAIYAALIELFAGFSRNNRGQALSFANAAAAKGSEEKFDLTIGLLDMLFARLVRTGVMARAPVPEAAPGEAALLMRLSRDPAMARAWAELAEVLSVRLRHGRAVNLDPAALILDTVFRIQQTVQGQHLAISGHDRASQDHR